MAQHESKYCPRCHQAFECKVGSILLCQCMEVNLSQKERAYMQDKFDDCLCVACMKAIKAEYQHNLLP